MIVHWTAVLAAGTALAAAPPWSVLPLKLKDDNHTAAGHSLPDLDVFHHMFTALSDMQDAYFQRWLGTWPSGIDWTRAVMNTHVAATLRTISRELELDPAECATARKEDLVAGYFADVIAYYFGEDAFSIRNQAYDDILWVVLGWLESVQLINEHGRSLSASSGGGSAEPWFGSRWTPAFAHRARVFWELAAKGWDTTLCGGGMIWNPRLTPYKNAITNELFISASISMYLHFPGDANTSPFHAAQEQPQNQHTSPPWPPRDPIFALAAQRAHLWLSTSNMTNAQGLYADGFHISPTPDNSNETNTKCDVRDEMVYTYNQGVLLSGLAGLYRATGRGVYLKEGHALIQRVVQATGWDLARGRPVDWDGDTHRVVGGTENGKLPPWRGLGRAGVLEEACDVLGRCSQDGQTFKGIWMHHFAGFCAPRGVDRDDDDNDEVTRRWHYARCARYVPWLRHNARAALGTRDERGLFGMWWTAGILTELNGPADLEGVGEGQLPAGAVDYRNEGVPLTDVWVPTTDLPQAQTPPPSSGGQKPLGGGDKSTLDGKRGGSKMAGGGGKSADETRPGAWDPNLRGRGRTLETQGGGLGVLRALWVVSRHEA